MYGQRPVFDSEQGYLQLDRNQQVEKYRLSNVSTDSIAAAFLVRSYLESLAYGLLGKSWFTVAGYYGFSLIDPQTQSPRPAYAAYAVMTKMLDGAEYVGAYTIFLRRDNGYQGTPPYTGTNQEYHYDLTMSFNATAQAVSCVLKVYLYNNAYDASPESHNLGTEVYNATYSTNVLNNLDSVVRFFILNPWAADTYKQDRGGIAIDNVYTSVPVPEPASVAVASLALVGFAAIRRRLAAVFFIEPEAQVMKVQEHHTLEELKRRCMHVHGKWGDRKS